jgi:hypothetical protein
MTVRADCGRVVIAGDDAPHALPLHSDGQRNVPDSFRLDTKFTTYPNF